MLKGECSKDIVSRQICDCGFIRDRVVVQTYLNMNTNGVLCYFLKVRNRIRTEQVFLSGILYFSLNSPEFKSCSEKFQNISKPPQTLVKIQRRFSAVVTALSRRKFAVTYTFKTM